jgi:hypothetical protein
MYLSGRRTDDRGRFMYDGERFASDRGRLAYDGRDTRLGGRFT